MFDDDARRTLIRGHNVSPKLPCLDCGYLHYVAGDSIVACNDSKAVIVILNKAYGNYMTKEAIYQLYYLCQAGK